MVTVPGATPLFEQAGVLGTVAELACHWFDEFLVGRKFDRPSRETNKDRGGRSGAGTIRPTMADPALSSRGR